MNNEKDGTGRHPLLETLLIPTAASVAADAKGCQLLGDIA
jgi:hypothetical protein